MTMKKIAFTVLGTVALVAVTAVAVIQTGIVSVAADEQHTEFVTSILATAREQSIARRSDEIKVPDLESPEIVRIGATQYREMCAGCHLAPGYGGMDLRPGLNPQPPDLTKLGVKDPARTFWIVKHGIKMTGMPAWGVNHDDETLWSIVAFLKKLPDMTEQQYALLLRRRISDSHTGSAGLHQGSDQVGGHSHNQPHSHGKHSH